MKAIAIFVAGAVAVSPFANAFAIDCGLTEKFRHKSKAGKSKWGKPIYKKIPIYGGSGELFFTGKMAVNTDGAPSSYHPDDPDGSRGLAINTICNGANALKPMRNGGFEKIDYTRCGELVEAFREAKSGNWVDPQKPKMQFFAVANEYGVPCTIKTGDYAGYFVSITKLPADASKKDCDQERWLNALDIPFIIVPRKSEFVKQGVGQGDLAVLVNPSNGKKTFAIVGDEGPNWGLAEGSVAIAKSLLDRQENPKTRKETYAFVIPNAKILIFPGNPIAGPYTSASIAEAGRSRLEAWGGQVRLDSCVKDL